jgi:hypothetical protein
MEEGGQISGDRRWFLSRSKVPAVRKDCPALDVVEALQIRARRFALRNRLVCENTNGKLLLEEV